MNILGIIGAVTNVLPFVETIITSVESLFGGGNGASKLQAATSATIATLQAYATAAGTSLPATIEADIATAISANVKVMNDLGLLLPPGSPSNVVVKSAAAGK